MLSNHFWLPNGLELPMGNRQEHLEIIFIFVILFVIGNPDTNCSDT